MPEGGALTVVVAREDTTSVAVTFADEGVGMSQPEIRRAFEPFQTNFDEGTGLGLAVVFRIVQEHRGRIRVRSRVGKGTEVRLTLPASQGVPIAPGAAHVETAGAAS